MNRPPMKKTATRSVARTCERRSWVRERISRNVHIIRLSQKMTVKATIKPMTIPSELVRVDNVLLPEEDAVAVAVAVGTTVGVATAGPVVSIVVSICVIDVMSGQTPLSEKA